MDPITFSIIRHRLFRVIDEAVITLKQVSGSAITNEGHDLMVSLYRADGSLLMGGVGFLHHLTSAAEACKAVIRRFEGDIGEGDVFLTNCPYTAALHTSDIYLVAPIHHGGRLVAWSACFVPCLRHRRHGTRRIQPGFARYLHRRLQLARYQAGRRRGDAPRCDGYGAQHGARAGDGGTRPLLHDRGQQCGAGADGRID